MLKNIYFYHTQKDAESVLEAEDMLEILERSTVIMEDSEIDSPQLSDWLYAKIELIEDLIENEDSKENLDIDVAKENLKEEDLTELYSLFELAIQDIEEECEEEEEISDNLKTAQKNNKQKLDNL